MKKGTMLVVFCAIMCMICCRMEKNSTTEKKQPDDTWGQIIEAPPEALFAADLSDDVRNGLTNTLLAATAEWGNYGPVEN